MRIGDSGLVDVAETYKPSPNGSGAFHDPPRFIVAHWTGGSRLDGAVSWLCNPVAKASAHFVVGRDGKFAQLVSVNKIAWHAGPSEWKVESIVAGDQKKVTTYTGLNKCSIGIEFVNLGKLKRTEAGTFFSSTGHVVDPAEVSMCSDRGYYQTYTSEQLAVADELVSALKEYFPSIEDVIGHHHIAPKRKIDPGPLFPFDHYRARIHGRE